MDFQKFAVLFQQTVFENQGTDEFVTIERKRSRKERSQSFNVDSMFDSPKIYQNMTEISLYHIAQDKERLTIFDEELRELERQVGGMAKERAASVKFLRSLINKLLTAQLGEAVDIPNQQSLQIERTQ
ncbi:MAG: hypothetical protein GY801_21375 [bacterium]|nr:hypothetical protein [bacterium]